jgi:hypothetical protein
MSHLALTSLLFCRHALIAMHHVDVGCRLSAVHTSTTLAR